MNRVLLVEDDVNLLRATAFILEREGFAVTSASSGEEALAVAVENPPDLIVLDVNLPGMNGFDVCQKLKRSRPTRRSLVIMLTERNEVDDVVHGLDCLADDYVGKPCDPRVLIARIRALLRRSERSSPEHRKLTLAELHIDCDAREVRRDNGIVELTRTEFDLLYLLASHANRVFTRDQILDEIRAEALSTGERAIDVQVVGLRKKLGEAARHIETVRGIGYRFVL